jgi:hypothetical protein
MSLQEWECFPPYGDRVFHGYRWDRERDEFGSLCGRRTASASLLDPRSYYLNKRGGKKSEQPGRVDTYGYCQKCCTKAGIV